MPTFIPAKVVACLGSFTALVLYPGRMHATPTGRDFERFQEVSNDLVPEELRAPNTDIWLVVESVEDSSGRVVGFKETILPRTGEDAPDLKQTEVHS